jgi:hypothetical protein
MCQQGSGHMGLLTRTLLPGIRIQREWAETHRMISQ